MEQGGHSKVTPTLDSAASVLNLKRHTGAVIPSTIKRHEGSQRVHEQAAQTQPNLKHHKKKTRPDVCLVGFSISRHSVREAAFKRGAVQSGLKQAMAVPLL